MDIPLNDIIPLEIIEPGTKVTIEVTDEIYKRLQNIIFQYLPFKDMNHFSEVLSQINSGKYSDPICDTLHTILVLINLYETGAKDQGKIIKKSWSTTDKKIVNPS